MADREELEQLIITLLEPSVFKTTAQIVEEFRIEYPRRWRELEEEAQRVFGASCAAYQQPATRVVQALFSLPEKSRLCRREGDAHRWSK